MVPATIVENCEIYLHGFSHGYPHGLSHAISFPIEVRHSGYHGFCHGTLNCFPSAMNWEVGGILRPPLYLI